ncbi:hypothetical protein [Mesobacillus maritimus]|uniref:DUF5673 domain-containing protein n=1 Tax=Mesobacillus maritimus TaxID=1643336 RepID=A0ABS7K4X5_9BACI|nr:hypothetical protein [Mesobacillus maritimus]MBY0097316.1 hypothetical protein [Mesobacillus maritimus]
MKALTVIIPLFITLAGVFIPINALNLKSKLGRTFFIDEQKIKVRYFNTFLFSFIMAVLVAYFYLFFILNRFNNIQIESTEIGAALGLGTVVFFIFLLITSPLFTWINNFFIKDQILYKVVPSIEIGPVYILRMHDKDTCICSENPNAEFSQHAEYVLVSMEEILGKTLIEVYIPKPPRSFLSRLFDL